MLYRLESRLVFSELVFSELRVNLYISIPVVLRVNFRTATTQTPLMILKKLCNVQYCTVQYLRYVA